MHKFWNVDGVLVRETELHGESTYLSVNEKGTFSPFLDLARLKFRGNQIPNEEAVEIYRDFVKSAKDLPDEEIKLRLGIIEKCSTCNGTGKRFFIKRILYSCFVLTSIISSCLMLAWCALFYHDLAFGLAIITIWMGGYIAYDMWRVSEDKKKNRVAELQQRQQRERVRLKDEFEKIRLRVDQLIHTESPSRLKH